MAANFRRKPLYVFCFLAALSLPQICGLVRQFQLGFVPFIENPTRVPFSWDMFSNRADRCIVTWATPLKIGDLTIKSLRDVDLPLEWDIVFDQVPHYQMVATALCPYSLVRPNSVALDCFTAEGVELKDEIPCD